MTAEFIPTDEQREMVAIAAGAGAMTHEEMAIAIGISRSTLEKKFEDELAKGAYQRRLNVLQAMYQAAVKGNVTAAREYLSKSPRLAVPRPPEGEERPAPKLEKMGKKDQANADARTAHAGTDWEDDLRPRGTLQ